MQQIEFAINNRNDNTQFCIYTYHFVLIKYFNDNCTV